MSCVTRNIHRALIAAALTFVLTAPAALAAQKKQQPPSAAEAQDPAKAAAETARRAYEAGTKSFAAGKHQVAIDQLNIALRGGGLATPEMAKALYFRGVAYRKMNKPGLAISDLTSALWLKNGLSDAERDSATAERAEAYKAAGIADAGGTVRPEPVAAPATQAAVAPAPSVVAPSAATAPPAAAAPAAAVQSMASTSPTGDGVPQPLSLGGESAGPPVHRYARSEPSANINQAAALEQPYSVTADASPVPAPRPVLSAAPMDQPAAAATGGSTAGLGTGISGFFSNIFGSSTSPTQAPASVPTASTGQAAATQAVTPPSPSLTQSSVSQRVAAAEPAAMPPAPAQPAAKPAKTAKVKGGKYKIHIAAVRSRAEAEALAQKLNSEHGNDLASRTAAVDEAVIGSMGKFFRVRVGSFATADEPRGLCNSLRNSGYDCLVVTN